MLLNTWSEHYHAVCVRTAAWITAILNLAALTMFPTNRLEITAVLTTNPAQPHALQSYRYTHTGMYKDKHRMNVVVRHSLDIKGF